ncbi:GatB/YqeY domain-containing protein, partial [Daedalea quercina L-15889]
DMRSQLMSELKAAMKAKDSLKSTVFRSVLSEVYATDKAPSTKDGVTSSSTIVGIMRKGAQRRLDTAKLYEQSSRPELAAKEKQEAEILQGLLPPLLSEAEVDKVIQEIIIDRADYRLSDDPNPKRRKQLITRFFYERVDKSRVDGGLVNRRIDASILGS